MRRFVAIVAWFRFANDNVRRPRWSKVRAHVVARTILADSNHFKPSGLIFFVDFGCYWSFVAPVRTPGRKVNNHHEFLALNQRAQIDWLVILEIVECPVFVVDGFLHERRVLMSVLSTYGEGS